MTLLVETPDTSTPERDYILAVLLGDFLGLPWRRVSDERRDVRITLEDQPGEIRLPDTLFSTPDADWLTGASMPRSPLAQWDTRDLAEDITLVEPVVPVIYGDRQPSVHQGDETIALPVDIFGSAFFMLSRYEELVTPDRDEHDRFPAWASLALKERFLKRPIVDEYVEILWATIAKLWPKLKRRYRQPRTRVTHDVDRPARYAISSVSSFLRAIGGDMLKRRDLSALVNGPRARLRTGNHLHRVDPYNTFDWLMDLSEGHDITSAFYFISGKTYKPYDPPYNLGDPPIRSLIRRIHERGHEVGLHPGYRTYRDPAALGVQADRLRAVCDEEGVHQAEWGGRMHYLQWSMDVTPLAWEKAGMAYDSTLGYADRTGFRCGTSHDFPLFSWSERVALSVRERPLIAMDVTVLSKKYMGVTQPEEITAHLEELRSLCRMFDGNFNILWHNSELSNAVSRETYRKLIQ